MLLCTLLLGLSGCDSIRDFSLYGERVYPGKVWESHIFEETMVLRDTVKTPSFGAGYLFERVEYATGNQAYKDSASRILYASFFLIRQQYDPKMMVKDKKYRVSAMYDRAGQTTRDIFCKIENYRPCVEKYDSMWIGSFHIVSIEPLP